MEERIEQGARGWHSKEYEAFHPPFRPGAMLELRGCGHPFIGGFMEHSSMQLDGPPRVALVRSLSAPNERRRRRRRRCYARGL